MVLHTTEFFEYDAQRRQELDTALDAAINVPHTFKDFLKNKLRMPDSEKAALVGVLSQISGGSLELPVTEEVQRQFYEKLTRLLKIAPRGQHDLVFLEQLAPFLEKRGVVDEPDGLINKTAEELKNLPGQAISRDTSGSDWLTATMRWFKGDS